MIHNDECIEWQVMINFGYQKFHKFLIKIIKIHNQELKIEKLAVSGAFFVF